MEMIPVTMQVPAEMLAKAMASQVSLDRHAIMVDKYGEACTKTTAAQVIGCSAKTICNLLNDGRIKSACEGTRVDVRSLADYIERTPEADRKARLLKTYGSTRRV